MLRIHGALECKEEEKVGTRNTEQYLAMSFYVTRASAYLPLLLPITLVAYSAHRKGAFASEGEKT